MIVFRSDVAREASEFTLARRAEPSEGTRRETHRRHEYEKE
jgi:hypothetical protein